MRKKATAKSARKTAGPSYKEEEEVEDEPETSDDDDDDMTERRARPVEEEEEDNTLSLAQMEEALKPAALERFAKITSLFKKFSNIQLDRMRALNAGEDFSTASENKYHKLREELTAEVESVAVPREQDRVSCRPAILVQPPFDRPWWPDAAFGRTA